MILYVFLIRHAFIDHSTHGVHLRLQAAQRQTKWEQSAVGKATNKAARAAREDRYQSRAGQDTAKDWLN